MVAVAPRESQAQPNPTQVIGLNGWMGGLNWSSDLAHVRLDELVDSFNMDIMPDGGLQARRRWTFGKDLSHLMDSSGNGSVWAPRNAGKAEFQFRTIMWQAYPHTDDPTNPQSRLMVCGLDGGTWTEAVPTYTDNGNIVRGNTPAGFDGAQWDFDYYFATGIELDAGAGAARPAKLDPSDFTQFIPLEEPRNVGWNNTYRDENVDGYFPRCNTIAAHMGYMFAGGTRDTGDVKRYNRLRWSHPANPEAWAQKDYLDVFEGGETITHIEAFEDQLVIFKDRSIWALYGYSPATWELKEVTREMGVFSSMAVTSSGDSIWFANDLGVWRYASDGSIEEISAKIANFFRGGDIPVLIDPWGKIFSDDHERFIQGVQPWPGTATLASRPPASSGPSSTNVLDAYRFAVSWVDSRLWVSVSTNWPIWYGDNGLVDPNWRDGVSNPYPITLVFDPFRGENGVWTTYSGHNWNCVGRVVQFRNFEFEVPGQSNRRGDRFVAFTSMHPTILVVEDPSDERSEYRHMTTHGTPDEDMVYAFRTAWLHGGNPGLKKRFRRPDLTVRSAAYSYDEVSAELTDIGLFWMTYDDMSFWEPDRYGYIVPPHEMFPLSGDVIFTSSPDRGVEQLQSLGTRKAVSFGLVARGAFDPETFFSGSTFGLPGVLATGHELQVSTAVFKFIPRRLV